ncbi:VOC family protein [Myxococcota bacterium]|nr:VOC family protein [Myxococcota bacterium]
MPLHHVAIATRDMQATHEFYTSAMGFEIAKVVVAKSGSDGWAKHVFYDTGLGSGSGLIAFWDLHDDDLPSDWSPAIATGLGLPPWTNHLAFEASDAADLEARRKRWLGQGVDVVEVDHGWCRSIYANDPNGILVEFCLTTRALDATDREEALRLLADPAPEVEGDPPTRIHRAPRDGGAR